MRDFKHYCDLQIIRDLPLINENEIIASSAAIKLIENKWNEYMSAGTMARYQYTDREKGSYLFFTIVLAKKCKNAKEIESFYTVNVYRNSTNDILY